MKTSLLTKKANSRRNLLTKRIGPLLALALVLSISFLVLPTVTRVIVAFVWYPFDSVRVWVNESGSSLPQYLRERSALLAEIEANKIAIAIDQGTENTITRLQIENDAFRTQLGAVPAERLLARVVARPNQLPYDVVMIDRGTDQGVVQNAPVFLGKDQVVGFVSSVNPTNALVTLVTTAGFRTSAYVIGPNIYTETEGMGGGILRVRVPQGILLQADDLVILPAIDSGVYGEVSYVEAAATQPEQYGYVAAAVPLQSLYYVSVGREPMVTHSFAEAQTVVADVQSDLFTVAVPEAMLVVPETFATTSTTTSSRVTVPTTTPTTTTPH